MFLQFMAIKCCEIVTMTARLHCNIVVAMEMFTEQVNMNTVPLQTEVIESDNLNVFFLYTKKPIQKAKLWFIDFTERMK